MFRDKSINLFFLCSIGMLLGFTNLKAQFYNGTQGVFGKNKIQYKDYLWSYYKYQKFNVYFNDEAKNLANYVAISAHVNLLDIEDFFDYTLSNKIEFIVYKTQDLSRTSNIGNIDDIMADNGAGVRANNNRVFLFDNGNKKDLDIQIRKGIAMCLIQEVLYGQEYNPNIRSSVLLFLPQWYAAGLANFVAENWNVERDNELRNLFVSRKKVKIYDLNEREAALVGQNIWYQIADQYGKNVVPKMLFVAASSRNTETSFSYVLGLKMNDFIKDWRAVNQEIYGYSALNLKPNNLDVLPVKYSKKNIYIRPKSSPNQAYLVYNQLKYSRHSTYLKNTETNETKRLLKIGHKIDILPDYSFPISTWHPNGEFLSLFFEKEGELNWWLINPKEDEILESKIPQLDKILYAEYSPSGSQLLFIGTKMGKTDLYVMDVQSRNPIAITNDYFDIYSATYLNNAQIIFSSNRDKDTLGIGGLENKVFSKKNNLYLVNILGFKPTKNHKIIPLKNMPVQFDNLQSGMHNKFYFTSNQTGINNLYVGLLDSAITHVDTAIHYSYFVNHKKLSDWEYGVSDVNYVQNKLNWVYHKGKKTFIQTLETYNLLETNENYTPFVLKKYPKLKSKNSSSISKSGITVDSLKSKMIENPNFVLPKYYIFNSELQNTEKDTTIILSDNTIDKFQVFKLSELPSSDSSANVAKLRNYEVEFKTFDANVELSNTFLNPSYQVYTGTGGNLTSPVSGFTQFGIVDVLEDYKIIGGFRFGNIGNYETLLTFANYKKRWDKQYTLYRGSFTDFANNIGTKNVLYDFLVQLTYPFKMVNRFQVTFSMRMDQFIPLSFNESFLRLPNVFVFKPNIRLNYTYDDTRPLAINLRAGTRFKLFNEYYVNALNPQLHTITYGLDYRYYYPLYKKIIWANRLAGGGSVGTERLMHYLGGVDNWMFNQFNNNLNSGSLPQGQNYAYQTLGNNMRGFQQNIRNGTAFMSISTEVRIPIVSLLYPKPINNPIIQNFQLITFADLGSAWTGFQPFSKRNTFNEQNFTIGNPENPVARIRVESKKQPFVFGYGVGARTQIFSYFIRLDYARGIGDGNTQKSIFYLSLAKDF